MLYCTLDPVFSSVLGPHLVRCRPFGSLDDCFDLVAPLLARYDRFGLADLASPSLFNTISLFLHVLFARLIISNQRLRASTTLGCSDPTIPTDLFSRMDGQAEANAASQGGLEGTLASMAREITRLGQQNLELQQRIATVGQQTGGYGLVRPPKPPVFEGKMGEVHSWLWAMSKFFHAAETPATRQVAFADTLLRGAAAQWRHANNNLTTWEQYATAIKLRFSPISEERWARMRLDKLVQRTSVARYAELFQATILLVPDQSPTEQVHKFCRGLKPEAEREVRMRNPTTLEEAIRIATELDEALNLHRRFRGGNLQAGPFRGGNRTATDSDVVPMELGAMQGRRQPTRRKKRSADERRKLREEGRCFVCAQVGHLARDCTSRGQQERSQSEN